MTEQSPAATSAAYLRRREPPLDTAIEIITPENIAFTYRLAGPFRRLPAFLVDLSLRGLILFVGGLGMWLVSAWIGLAGVGAGGALTLWFLVSWFYGGLFETLWNGQTPGKRMLGLRVLSADGQPINAQQAVLRNVLRSVDALPMALPYGFGLLAAAGSRRFQRLGDLACGTMVVVEDVSRRAALVAVNEPEVARLAAALPPALVVSPGLARSLSGYVSRRKRLSWGRRVEVARHLAEPLRQRYGLPAGISYDLLLCALYQRTFLAEGALGPPRPGEK